MCPSKNKENSDLYEAADAWSDIYSGKHDIFYPAEYVVRIFKGHYPNLGWQKSFDKKKILDLGCGDGRHLLFFNTLGMESHGIEISESIAEDLRVNLKDLGVKPESIHSGSSSSIPFEDATFDFLMGWNSIYYMSLQDSRFEDHASEIARVIKPGGYVVLSIPKKSAFIFDNSEYCSDERYKVIKDDYYGGMRNGEIMRVFNSSEEIKSEFEPYFDEFYFGDIQDDCFGLNFHWHLVIARRSL